ncbi:MAG: 50S ribosomal protein L17, partial [Coriobacteriia bacterium]|nr:50S ribosomal protein L17 [Coriobacteriia bacterium]
MRHYKRGRKLGTDASHTKAIKKSLVANLFLNDRVKTTLERAKEIRGDVDRIVTWAKRGDVHSRRLAIAALGDKDLVAEIFSKVGQGLFEGRPGGYTRILRLGKRRGDAATIVIMELVQEPVGKKDKSDKAAASTKGKGAAQATAKAPVVEKIEEAYEKAETAGDEAAETEAGQSGVDEAEVDEAEAAEAEAEAAEAAPETDEAEAKEADEAEAESEQAEAA